MVAFKDLNDYTAREHILIIPKQHIININYLTNKHLPLIKEMKQEALKLLSTLHPNSDQDYILGFHIPPFTSVDHLHLHCIVGPIQSYYIKFKKVLLIMRNINTTIKSLEQL